MIKFKLNKFRSRIYFKIKPTIFEIFSLNEYIQCKYIKNIFGFNRIVKYTKFIDLTLSEEEILNNFKKNTRYDIRKSEMDGNIFITNNKFDIFVDYYNDFAEKKGLTILDKENFKEQFLSSNILITSIVNDKEILAMHSYMIDKTINRVRLWYSASIFRQFEKQSLNRNIVARANKSLHYHDIKVFKSKGYLLYDFGGYAYNTDSSDLIGINNFKDQFGGELVEESNYTTFIYYILKKIKTYLT